MGVCKHARFNAEIIEVNVDLENYMCDLFFELYMACPDKLELIFLVEHNLKVMKEHAIDEGYLIDTQNFELN